MTEFDIERQNRAINTIDSRDNAREFSQRLKLSAEWEVYVDMEVGWLENRLSRRLARARVLLPLLKSKTRARRLLKKIGGIGISMESEKYCCHSHGF